MQRPSSDNAVNNSASISQAKPTPCTQCQNPGYIGEPYHIPGYTGHIPTMRYRHGGSFGRTSRNVFEDPCVPLTPVPVLVPLYKPRKTANEGFHKRKPDTKADTSPFQAQNLELQQEQQISRKFDELSRMEPSRPHTAIGLSQEAKNKIDSTEFVKEMQLTASPREASLSPRDSDLENCNNSKNYNNNNPRGGGVEIFQLPCWPSPSSKEIPASNWIPKNQFPEEKQRPVTAGGDLTYQSQQIDPNLSKLIEEAFRSPSHVRVKPPYPQQPSIEHQSSRTPTRQMHYGNQIRDLKENVCSPINYKETLPPRPQTSFYYPKNVEVDGPGNSLVVNSEPISRDANNYTQLEQLQSQQVPTNLSASNYSTIPRRSGSFSSGLQANSGGTNANGSNFYGLNPNAGERPNNTGVNRSPYARSGTVDDPSSLNTCNYFTKPRRSGSFASGMQPNSEETSGTNFSRRIPNSGEKSNAVVNRSPFARLEENSTPYCNINIDTNIYRFSEGLASSYQGHVPGYAFNAYGRTYGKATEGTKQYLEKCMNRRN